MRDAAPLLEPALLAEELGTALLPILRRFLTRSTARLRELDERLAQDDGALRDERLLAWLEEARGQEERVGWALGVLASASGSDLLLARRERDGLRTLVELVLAALGDRPLLPGVPELPEVSASLGQGWELPLLVSWLLLRLGVASAEATPLRWGLVEASRRQTLYLAGTAEAAGVVGAAVGLDTSRDVPLGWLSGTRLALEGDALAVLLPECALVPKPVRAGV